MVALGRTGGRITLAAVISSALVTAGCGTSAGSPSAAAPEPTVAAPSRAASSTLAVATDPTLGDIVVGEGGKTLYVFTKDAGGKSVCNDDCATAWPPLLVEAGAAAIPGEGVTGYLNGVRVTNREEEPESLVQGAVGRTLTWPNFTIFEDDVITIKMLLVVGPVLAKANTAILRMH